MAGKDIKPRTETGLTRREVLGKALKTGAGALASDVLDSTAIRGLTDLVLPPKQIIYDAPTIPTVASSLANLVAQAEELDVIVDDSPLVVNYEQQPSITLDHYYVDKGKLYENTPKLPSRRVLNNPNFIEDLADEVEGSSWEYLESWNEIGGPNFSDEQGMDEIENWSYNIREAGDNYQKALEQLERSIRAEYDVPTDFKGVELAQGDALIDYADPAVLSDIMTKIKKDFPEALQVPGSLSTIRDGKRVLIETTEEEAAKIRNKGIELIKKHLQKSFIDSIFYSPTKKLSELEIDPDPSTIEEPDPSTIEDRIKDVITTRTFKELRRALGKLGAPKPEAIEGPKPEAPKQIESKSPVQMANIASALSRFKRATPIGAAAAMYQPSPAGEGSDIVPPYPLIRPQF
jgi:hypothetical protein